MKQATDIFLAGKSFEFDELLDVARVQQLMSSFCEAVGVASAVIDLNGRVLVAANWQSLCTEFHRRHPESLQLCLESDTRLALNLREGENFAIYRCRNGLVDCASPVVVRGKHLANVFIGQFLLGPPDLDFFKEQAARLGFAEEEYLQAVADVPVVAEEKLPAILLFLSGLAQTVATLALERLAADWREQVVRQALDLLAGPCAQLSGREFYEAICRFIAETLELDYVFVGELLSAGNEVRTLGGWAVGASMPPLAYQLEGTPCEKVAGREVCVYRQQVQQLFPTDLLLGEMGVESYCGIPLFDKQGQPLGVLVALGKRPLGEDHPVSLLLSVFVDQVSADIQRTRYEETLRRASEEAARLNEVMAHHFQEPSRRLVTFSSELLRRGEAAGPERQSLLFIEQQARYLHRLVRDIQRYLRISRGERDWAPVDAKVVWEQVLRDFVESLQQAQATVEQPDSWPAVLFDPGWLKEILTIILDNAILYRRPDRPLLLALTVERQGSRIVWCLRDNGKGIAPEHREQAFVLFTRQQNDGELSRGTGIGLPIMRKMVTLAGGRVRISEGIDGGTAVQFDLPEA